MVNMIVVGASVLILLGYIVYVWCRSKLSAEYAARRKLRAEEKYNREREKRRERRESEEGRLREWAEQNPDKPDAKALLANEESSSLVSPISADTRQDDIGVALLQAQHKADALARQIEESRIAKERFDQSCLEWAMKNPETPQGQRHLVETQKKAHDRIDDADRMIRIYRYSSDGMSGDSVEGIEAATKVAEAEATKEAAMQLLAEITAVLRDLPLDSQK